MLPICFEWHWDIGHFIFFGLFYAAVTVVFGTLLATIVKTTTDLWSGHAHVPHDEEHEGGHEGEEAAA